MAANVVNNANSNNNNNNNNNNDNNDNVNNFNIANNNNAGNNFNDIQICPFPCIPGPPPVIVGERWLKHGFWQKKIWFWNMAEQSANIWNVIFTIASCYFSKIELSGRRRRSEKSTLMGRLTEAALTTQIPVRNSFIYFDTLAMGLPGTKGAILCATISRLLWRHICTRWEEQKRIWRLWASFLAT